MPMTTLLEAAKKALELRRIVTAKQLREGFQVRYLDGSIERFYYAGVKPLGDGTFDVREPECDGILVVGASREFDRSILTPRIVP